MDDTTGWHGNGPHQSRQQTLKAGSELPTDLSHDSRSSGLCKQLPGDGTVDDNFQFRP
jgi:hypothetical protein